MGGTELEQLNFYALNAKYTLSAPNNSRTASGTVHNSVSLSLTA